MVGRVSGNTGMFQALTVLQREKYVAAWKHSLEISWISLNRSVEELVALRVYMACMEVSCSNTFPECRLITTAYKMKSFPAQDLDRTNLCVIDTNTVCLV